METRIWEQILGEHIYNGIDHTACEKLKERLSQEHDSCLYRIYEDTDSYYCGSLPEINFENFYRFFLQIAAKYTAVKADGFMAGKEQERMVANNVLRGIVRIPVRCLIHDIRECVGQKDLSGNDEWEEYRDYEEHFLGKPEYIRQLCQKYPELLRLLLLRIRQIVCQLVLIRNVVEEQNNNDLKIKNIELGLSDVHTEGRTAARVYLSNGRKLLYKPRSLRKDKLYQNINRWFCIHLKLNVRKRKIIETENGGLDEYVESRPCQEEAEIRRFFYRLGIQIFICYLTDTSDIHGENLIADGEYPELIDLETMPGAVRFCKYPESDIGRIKEFLEQSVLHTGILPGTAWGAGSRAGGVNVLHSEETCATPFKLPVLSHPRSSKIRIDYEQRKITFRSSIPCYKGKLVAVQKYVQELCSGFHAAYCLAMKERKELSRLFEPLFLEESRFLLRHTQQYDMYLSASLSPEFMEHTVNRIYLLHVLKKTEKKDSRQALFFKYELKSLMNLEIPIYHFVGKARQLRDGDGNVYPEYFEQSSFERFQNRLSRLSAEDLKKQDMMIRLSMGCNLPQTEESRYVAFKYPVEGKKRLIAIARHIAGLRIEAGNRSVYLKLNLSGKILRLEAAGMNLYDGIPGLAVFFAAVMSVSRTREFDDLYQDLIGEMFRYTRECLEGKKEAVFKGTGMFIGEGSIVYGYLLLYQISGTKKFLDYAKKHTRAVLCKQDSCFDLLSGNAGWILVLLKLYQITAEDNYLCEAVRTGEILWEQRVELENGCGWLCASENVPLAGMSHGNSGMILAYAGLLKNTGNRDYVGWIKELIEYEDSLYLEEENNWSDLRSRKHKRSHSNAWCHGGSGILLSRIRLAEIDEFRRNERVRQDIERGIRCLMEWEKDDSVCICHGLAGKYMIMEECGRVLKREDIKEESLKVRQRLLEAEKIPVQEYYSTSFLSGIAGAGIALLPFPENVCIL